MESIQELFLEYWEARLHIRRRPNWSNKYRKAMIAKGCKKLQQGEQIAAPDTPEFKELEARYFNLLRF